MIHETPHTDQPVRKEQHTCPDHPKQFYSEMSAGKFVHENSVDVVLERVNWWRLQAMCVRACLFSGFGPLAQGISVSVNALDMMSGALQIPSQTQKQKHQAHKLGAL